MSLNIAVLITCHNRKEKTIKCLLSLYNQCGLGTNFIFDVFLVDDGSLDGTSEAIRLQFPEVKIINGNGKLYWNRGMYLAWQKASLTKDYDYFMWLNDDTFLFKNAMEILMFKLLPNSIICGVTKSSITGRITYGGRLNKSNNLLIPNGYYQNVDYCNGNCVIVPRNVFNKLGNLDPIFQHALGDFDYSRRAIKHCFEVLISSDYIGFCEINDSVPRWLNNSNNVIKRLKYLYHPLSGCKPSEFFILNYRQNGFLIAFLGFFTLHFKAIFPSIYFIINKRKLINIYKFLK